MTESKIENASKSPQKIYPWSRSLKTDGVDVYPGVTIFPKISGAQSNGEFSAFVEHVTSDYSGSPHVHYKVSETIILLEGSVYMRISGEDITLNTGDWVHIPPGNPHSFKSNGKPAKWILFKHPGDPDEKTVGQPPMPPEIMVDRKKADRYFFENVPDFHNVPEMGFPGDPK